MSLQSKEQDSGIDDNVSVQQLGERLSGVSVGGKTWKRSLKLDVEEVARPQTDASVQMTPHSLLCDLFKLTETGVTFHSDAKQTAAPLSSQQCRLSQFYPFGGLGNGASASVEKCVRIMEDHEVSICALKKVRIDSKSKQDQLLRELRMYFSLCSPPDDNVHGILKFLGACYDQGTAYLALEYMNRGSLKGLLQRHDTVPESNLCYIAKQLLLGLEFIHGKLHIHRDLKVANVLLNHRGDTKLADFGILAALEDNGHCMDYVGTHTYMSPERISAQMYSMSSDIWSLGVILLYCAVGQFPFKSDMGVFALVQMITVDKLPELPPTFSSEFRSFVSKCLIRDVTTRWTAQQLLEHPFVVDVDLDNRNQQKFVWSSVSDCSMQDMDTVCGILCSHLFTASDPPSAALQKKLVHTLSLQLGADPDQFQSVLHKHVSSLQKP